MQENGRPRESERSLTQVSCVSFLLSIQHKTVQTSSVQPVSTPSSKEPMMMSSENGSNARLYSVLSQGKSYEQTTDTVGEARVISQPVQNAQGKDGQTLVVACHPTTAGVPLSDGVNRLVERVANNRLALNSGTEVDSGMHVQRKTWNSCTELVGGTHNERIMQQRKRGHPDIKSHGTKVSGTCHPKRHKVAARECGTQSDPLPESDNIRMCYTCHQALGINDSRISLNSVQKDVKLIDALRQMHWSGLFPASDDSLLKSFCCVDCANLVIGKFLIPRPSYYIKLSWLGLLAFSIYLKCSVPSFTNNNIFRRSL